MLYDYNKTKRTIESCDKKEQIKTCLKMVQLFHEKHHDKGQTRKLITALNSKEDQFIWF